MKGAIKRDTGSPRADAESDFLRARRQEVLASLAARFRPDGVADSRALSFDDALAALGRRGERRLGRLVIPLDRIVGSVDKAHAFDRSFRPTSPRARTRWEHIAEAVRRGETMPPIDVYKLGDMYFVIDGHHRVSVYRALGLDLIEANVTEIDTTVSANDVGGVADLDRRHWRRILYERVPLRGEARKRLKLTVPSAYGRLAEMVEAWSARRLYADGGVADRALMAQRWYDEEFVPVMEMIDEIGLRASKETEADAYLRIAGERYQISREHVWDDEVLRLIRRGRRRAKSPTVH
jgi:hypothetical protein